MKEFLVRIDDKETDLRVCREKSESLAAEMGFTGNDLGDIVSAVFEACVNAVTHGRKGAAGPITLQLRTYPDRFEAVVKDSGNGFTCPQDTPIPPSTAPRGRGIPLMRAFMDELHVEIDGGCKVTLVKYLPVSSDQLSVISYQ